MNVLSSRNHSPPKPRLTTTETAAQGTDSEAQTLAAARAKSRKLDRLPHDSSSAGRGQTDSCVIRKKAVAIARRRRKITGDPRERAIRTIALALLSLDETGVDHGK